MINIHRKFPFNFPKSKDNLFCNGFINNYLISFVYVIETIYLKKIIVFPQYDRGLNNLSLTINFDQVIFKN